MTHGSYATYTVHRCRCDACRKANRDYERARAKRAASGRTFFVPAEPIRKRWLALRAAGMSDNEIERAAGIDDKVVETLFRKHWRTGKPIGRMKRENAERIMAVRRRAPLRHTLIEVPDFREMTLDLMALGYSGQWIAAHLGMSYQGHDALLRTTVRAETYAAMLRLHGATAEPAPDGGSATRSRNFAARMRPTHKAAAEYVIDADAVQAMLDHRKVDVAAFCEAAAISKQTWSQLRIGRRCTEDTAERIARAAGCSLASVMRRAA